MRSISRRSGSRIIAAAAAVLGLSTPLTARDAAQGGEHERPRRAPGEGSPPTAAAACVGLPAILGDGMVLLQNADAALWGTTDRAEVTVVTSWNGRRHTAHPGADGRWSLRVRTPAAGGPHRITFCPGELDELVLEDVLVGEVWLASGQSNMRRTVAESAEAETMIPRADYPRIRYFEVAPQIAAEPRDDTPGSTWVRTSPENAGSFSAVAYYFARELHERTGVPVGIIKSSWSGTSAEAWTPRPVLAADPRLRVAFERWAKWERDTVSTDPETRKEAQYMMARPHREPAVLFNGMIAPLAPFTIKGFLWYQGESNIGWPDEYRHLLGRMIDSWRAAWDGPVPFYIVQLPPFGYGDLDGASILREAQQDVGLERPNVYTLATMDLGDMKDIHPDRKRELGERLAHMALARSYGVAGVPGTGPTYRSSIVEGERIRVHFRGAERGLRARDGELSGFEISGRSSPGEFRPARARVEGGAVVVWSDDVPDPVAVRYGWGEAVTAANLVDAAGMPAAPFRTVRD